jgi:hypothetical protein
MGKTIQGIKILKSFFKKYCTGDANLNANSTGGNMMRKDVVFFLVLFFVCVFFVPPANSFAQMTMKKPLSLTQQNQATIASILPNTVTLQQGGPAAIVTVDGKFLETIQSVLAIKGGLGFSEISVKLVQPWPASRKIELQAIANAPVGPGYQLRFIGKAGLTEFRIDVPLTVFSLEVVGKKFQQMQQTTLPPQTLSTNAPPVKRANNDIEKMILDYLEQNPDAVDTVEGISKYRQLRNAGITSADISYTLEKLIKKGLLQTFLKTDGKHYYKLKSTLPTQAHRSATNLPMSITQTNSPTQTLNPNMLQIGKQYRRVLEDLCVWRGLIKINLLAATQQKVAPAIETVGGFWRSHPGDPDVIDFAESEIRRIFGSRPKNEEDVLVYYVFSEALQCSQLHLENIDLKNNLQKLQQIIQMLSNVDKVIQDTNLAVVRHIG